MNKYAIIVAGGQGLRMNSELPKQFIELNGLPLLMHTFNAFHSFDSTIQFILVLPENHIPVWKELCIKYRFNIEHKITIGGETRFHSVRNGLSLIKDEGIVFIHDGVRPFVSSATISNCYKTALEKGNALPVISQSESLREIKNNSNISVDRSRYFIVQTPQTFRVSLIKNAYRQAYSKHFTDDATVLESKGITINMVEGNRQNIKITYPEDIIIAETLLQKISK